MTVKPPNMEKYHVLWNNFLSTFGLSCLRPDRSDKDLVFKTSSLRLVPPILISLLLLYLLYFQIINTEFDFSRINSAIMSGYLNLVGLFMTILTIFSATLNSSSYIEMKSELLKFSRMHSSKDVSFALRQCFKYLMIVFFIFIVSLLWDYYILCSYPTVVSFLTFVSSYIYQFYNFLGITHFSVSLFWLRQCFTVINNSVSGYLLATELRPPPTRNGFFKTSAINKVSYIDNALNVRPKGNPTVEDLKHLRNLYHDAYQLTQTANSVFSTRNLVTVGHNFLLGTVFVYCGISELVNYTNSTSSPDSFAQLVMYFKWSAISFLSIYALIWPSIAVCSEAHKTSVSVQELLTKTTNSDLRSELHSFALQFVHERVSFSPHGFFSLNNKLLLSILGAVASYLVVLIQFRVSMS